MDNPSSNLTPSNMRTAGNFRVPRPTAPLVFTGERMTSAAEGQIEFEHYHRYCLARDLCVGLDVLDVASGEGYGAALLAGVANRVTGVEIDPAPVAHSRANYPADNLEFICGDAHALPLKDASVDVVVSFETLEHLTDQQRFLREVKRVLRPEGLFVTSTPDRSVYSAFGADPNPYHTLELTDPELRQLLLGTFKRAGILTQRPVLGSLVVSEANDGFQSYERRSADIIEATAGLARAHYLVAIASDGALPAVASSVYVDRRRVHDVVQAALSLPEAEARAAEAIRDRASAQAEAEKSAKIAADLRSKLASLETVSRENAAAQAELRALAHSMAALRAAERTWADAVSSNADLVRQRDAAVSAAAASAASYEAALRAAEHRANAAEHRASVAERAKATLAHEAETARQSLVAARRSLEAIVQSTSWRALAPLRSIGSRHPGLASAGRRAAKLVWWTATLQLGHRYLTRRQLRKSVALMSRPPSAPPPEEAAAVPEQPPFTAAPPAIRVVPETEPSMRRGDLLVACQALHRRTAIHFPPVAAPEVSIVIPVYKGLSDLRSCLRSIAATNTGDPSFEVILIDDCPEESVLQAVPDSGGLRKICNAQNMGFLLSCNKAAAAARGRIVCFLNSDTIVLPGWLSSLVDALDSTPGAAIAGGMLLNADDTIQDAGWRILGTGWGHPIGRGGDPGKGAYTYRRPADCVSGACLAVTKQALDELGGFDPAYAPAFYEEFDLAFRARKRGLLVIYEPKSRIIHLGSASYGPELRDQLSSINHATFVERFAEQMRKQPWDAADDFMLRHGVGHGSGPVLLVVDHAVPSPDRHAGDVTMTQYLSLLATAGWSVVFGPADGVAEGPAADALERQGIELIRSPQTIEDWLAEHGEHVSEVWLARPAIARRLIGPVRAFTRSRIAYYPHDLHHVRLDREAKVQGDAALLAEAASMRQEEIEILRAVDRVTAPCEEDGQAIRALAPLTPVTVMPPYFYDGSMILARDEARFEGLSDIVFVGGFPHTPNVDAAVFIAEEIMPLVWRSQPHARLMLVGYNPPPKVLALAGPRIVVTGQVPRTEPFMDRARLMLAALRYGAGVKGKVVEAMRLGVPVVTTSVGAEGIGIVPDRDALIGETAAELAQHVLDLFGSEQRCAELSVAGAELVRRRFSRRAARTAAGEAFRTPRCAVCGSGELIEPPPDSRARESFVCRNCFALGRTEALARVMLARLAPDGEGSLAELARRRPQRRVHEFGFVGGVADTLRGQPWFSTSEFFDDVERGASGPHGVRCEDLTRLTYEDESFDLVVSQDVMEHVPDPAAAFAETARVLRPGGSHVFTIPQNRDLAQSVVRARLDPYGVEYLLPPEYHGDPVRSQGALVFTDFGTDLVAILKEAGLTLVEHEVVVLGGRDEQVLRVFEGVKGELDLRAGPSSESRREAMLGDALGRMAVEGVRE